MAVDARGAWYGRCRFAVWHHRCSGSLSPGTASRGGRGWWTRSSRRRIGFVMLMSYYEGRTEEKILLGVLYEGIIWVCGGFRKNAVLRRA